MKINGATVYNDEADLEDSVRMTHFNPDTGNKEVTMIQEDGSISFKQFIKKSVENDINTTWEYSKSGPTSLHIHWRKDDVDTSASSQVRIQFNPDGSVWRADITVQTKDGEVLHNIQERSKDEIK